MLQKLEQRFQSNASTGTGTGTSTSETKAQSQSHSQDNDSDEDEDAAQEDDSVEMRLMHALRSSNLPFYQAVWDIARGSCYGLLALGKRFYWDGHAKGFEKEKSAPKTAGKKGGGEKQPNKDKRKSVFVDIVADDGEEWVKVSTMSESRLLFEMAKKGWERDSEDECMSDEGVMGLDDGRCYGTLMVRTTRRTMMRTSWSSSSWPGI